MAGISLVGLSGSMVKNAIKEPSLTSLDDTPPPGSVEEPEVTKVLIGELGLTICAVCFGIF